MIENFWLQVTLLLSSTDALDYCRDPLIIAEKQCSKYTAVQKLVSKSSCWNPLLESLHCMKTRLRLLFSDCSPGRELRQITPERCWGSEGTGNYSFHRGFWRWGLWNVISAGLLHIPEQWTLWDQCTLAASAHPDRLCGKSSESLPAGWGRLSGTLFLSLGSDSGAPHWPPLLRRSEASFWMSSRSRVYMFSPPLNIPPLWFHKYGNGLRIEHWKQAPPSSTYSEYFITNVKFYAFQYAHGIVPVFYFGHEEICSN